MFSARGAERHGLRASADCVSPPSRPTAEAVSPRWGSVPFPRHLRPLLFCGGGGLRRSVWGCAGSHGVDSVRLMCIGVQMGAFCTPKWFFDVIGVQMGAFCTPNWMRVSLRSGGEGRGSQLFFCLVAVCGIIGRWSRGIGCASFWQLQFLHLVATERVVLGCIPLRNVGK